MAAEAVRRREGLIPASVGKFAVGLMRGRCSGTVGKVLTAVGVATDSGTGNQGTASCRRESTDETAGETNRCIQIRGWVREKRRRVVLVRGPGILNLKPEAGVKSMDPTGAPISARNTST